MNIGAKIQTIRLDAKADAGGGRDWTQAACAKRAGMSVSQWADIEQGPTIVLLLGAAFAVAFVMSPRYGVLKKG